MRKVLLPRDLMGIYHSDIVVMWLTVSCVRGSSSRCRRELVCGMWLWFFLVILTFFLFQEKMKANMVVHLISKSII